MISYDQAEIGQWTGSLVRERAKKTKGENKWRDGRGLRSTCSARWFIFALFPTAEPVHRLSWNSHNGIDKGILATAWYCFKTRQTAIHINFSVALYYNSVNCDRLGECSAENDSLRWHWLTFRQPGWAEVIIIWWWLLLRSPGRWLPLRSPGRSQFTELWYDWPGFKPFTVALY